MFANGAAGAAFQVAVGSAISSSTKPCVSPCNGEVTINASTPEDYQIALSHMNTLVNDSGVNQASLATAMFDTMNAGARANFLHITNTDVANGVFTIKYAQSQQNVVNYGLGVAGVTGVVYGGSALAARYGWSTLSNSQKLEVANWSHRGIKRFVKEMDNLEIVDDVLSGGLKAPKYSPEPLPKPPYTYSQPF